MRSTSTSRAPLLRPSRVAADRQTLNITGSGQYRAENLTSLVIDLNVTGSGIVVVRVSDPLEGQITGSGRVKYIGDPVVAITVTGSVSKR